MTEATAGVSLPSHLIHLTRSHETLGAILFGATVLAMKPYGAIHDFPPLRESQLVSCFSAIGLADMPRLAARRGQFGLALNGIWMKSQGARPVTYLPRDSPTQQKYFELVKRSAFTKAFDPADRLWLHTPFIDYPKVPQREGDGSTYDWRWEREWRVRGDLRIDSPARVEFLVAPEDAHDALEHSWQWELNGGDGPIPPIMDANWPARDKQAALDRGPTTVVDEFASMWGDDESMDTAPPPLTWVDERHLDHEESLAEWAGWLEEMERDDI